MTNEKNPLHHMTFHQCCPLPTPKSAMQAYLNPPEAGVVGGRYIGRRNGTYKNKERTRKAYMSSRGHACIELETTYVVCRGDVGVGSECVCVVHHRLTRMHTQTVIHVLTSIDRHLHVQWRRHRLLRGICGGGVDVICSVVRIVGVVGPAVW
jgi:hypothetical protein